MSDCAINSNLLPFRVLPARSVLSTACFSPAPQLARAAVLTSQMLTLLGCFTLNSVQQILHYKNIESSSWQGLQTVRFVITPHRWSAASSRDGFRYLKGYSEGHLQGCSMSCRTVAARLYVHFCATVPNIQSHVCPCRQTETPPESKNGLTSPCRRHSTVHAQRVSSSIGTKAKSSWLLPSTKRPLSSRPTMGAMLCMLLRLCV